MTESYGFVWFLYVLCAGLAFAAWWGVTTFIKQPNVRIYLRLIPGVLLFVPASNGGENYAPAFIVAFGELLTNGLTAAMAGIIPILVALAVGVVLLVISEIFLRKGADKTDSQP